MEAAEEDDAFYGNGASSLVSELIKLLKQLYFIVLSCRVIPPSSQSKRMPRYLAPRVMIPVYEVCGLAK